MSTEQDRRCPHGFNGHMCPSCWPQTPSIPNTTTARPPGAPVQNTQRRRNRYAAVPPEAAAPQKDPHTRPREAQRALACLVVARDALADAVTAERPLAPYEVQEVIRLARALCAITGEPSGDIPTVYDQYQKALGLVQRDYGCGAVAADARMMSVRGALASDLVLLACGSIELDGHCPCAICNPHDDD